MYSYVSFWNIPRAQWGEMRAAVGLMHHVGVITVADDWKKASAADQKLLEKAMRS